MQCQICQEATKVMDSRGRGCYVVRRRKCVACGHGFTTLEVGLIRRAWGVKRIAVKLILAAQKL